jgi:hypothetical protein
MAISLIVGAAYGVYYLADLASDKKKARDKYYYQAQSDLLKQRSDSVKQTEEQRQEALKSIAKQYAVNAINQNLSVQKQAQEMADAKMKRDQIIVITVGVVAITLIVVNIIKTK